MEEDLLLYVDLPTGIEVLRPVLQDFPVEVEIALDEMRAEQVLVQSSVSTVAGLFFQSKDKTMHLYGVSTARASSMNTEEVVARISAALRRARVDHRITRLIHELDEEDLLASYESSGGEKQPSEPPHGDA